MSLVTADNHGPLINVGMWIALAPAIIMTGVKVYTKWSIARRLQLDDTFMMLTLLAATAQTVATTEEVRYGLGRNIDQLTNSEVDSVYLCEYVAQIFYVITIYFAKATSLSFFFFFLVGPHSRRIALISIITFVFAWTVIALFTVCFRCHAPYPWLGRSGGCIDETAFWIVNGVVDIFTQLLVAGFPIYVITGLYAQRAKRLLAMLSFTPNLLTIPLSIIRVYYVANTPRTGNYTWSSFSLALLTALHAVLSVFISGIPFSKPIVDSMVLAPISITDTSRGYVVSNKQPTNGKHRSQGASRLRDQSHSVLDSLAPRFTKKQGDMGRFAGTSHAEQELGDYPGGDGSRERIFRENGRLVIHQTRSTTVISTPHDHQTNARSAP